MCVCTSTYTPHKHYCTWCAPYKHIVYTHGPEAAVVHMCFYKTLSCWGSPAIAWLKSNPRTRLINTFPFLCTVHKKHTQSTLPAGPITDSVLTHLSPYIVHYYSNTHTYTHTYNPICFRTHTVIFLIFGKQNNQQSCLQELMPEQSSSCLFLFPVPFLTAALPLPCFTSPSAPPASPPECCQFNFTIRLWYELSAHSHNYTVSNSHIRGVRICFSVC